MARGDLALQTGRSQEEELRHGQSPWALTGKRLVRKRASMLALIIIATFYLMGIFAPWVAPYSYRAQNLDRTLEGPSAEHWLGTDRLGRDMLSRIIWGARTSVIVSVAAVLSGTIFLGVFLGALAGYAGRWVDAVIMRVGEIFLAFPGLLLIILFAATLRPRFVEAVKALEQSTGFTGLIESGAADYFVVFTGLAVFGWVGMARLVRGQLLALKEQEFVQAAIAAGATHTRIILAHLLPNTISPILVVVSMGLGGAIGSELVLSWLGIGVQPPTPSLGAMIFELGGQSSLQRHPHLLLGPISVVALVFFAFNLLGDGLNDALNPRTQ
ncbi:MAG: ABC transporter permease [Chloroflexi bacterium]|nr:ABC transporter permease [Chloroflexota bacterium]